MNINYNKKVLIGVALVLYIFYKMMGGWLRVLPSMFHLRVRGGRNLTADLLIKNQLLYLLTVIFIRLEVTLVACCATKCQEKSIRLTQTW